MSEEHSDAFVLFGATGDLAYKKIFPALHSMIKRGNSPGTHACQHDSAVLRVRQGV